MLPRYCNRDNPLAPKYHVKPRRQPGRSSFVATFRDHTGAQVTRGLSTVDERTAQLVCAGLVWLHHHRHDVPTPSDAPADISPRAAALFWGLERAPAARAIQVEAPLELSPDWLAQLPPLLSSQVWRLMRDYEALSAERERLQVELAAAHRELLGLRSSVLARAAAAEAACPPISEALTAFRAHLAAVSSATNARLVGRLAERFTATIAAQTTAEITPAQVGGWLDREAAKAPSPAIRRARHRIKLSRFLTWASRTYGHANPLDAVPPPSASQLEREQTDIHWHEIAVVEAAIEGLEPYWRALVGTLAFAGLRLSELIWLRRVDVRAEGERRLLTITTVEGEGGRHAVKSTHSRRSVEVHPTRLWPLLERHLADGAGRLFVFAMPPSVRRRPRNGVGVDAERWRIDTLSRHLARVLPAGVSPRSLRRTFGSLLLRDGCSPAEVAAAMGNTPDVVRRHYARILGSEVAVRF